MPDSFIDLSWLAGPTSRYPIDSSYSFDNLLETSLTDRNIWYKHLHGERKSRPPQFEGSFLRPYLGITWVLASWVWIPKSLDFDGCFSRFHVQILLEKHTWYTTLFRTNRKDSSNKLRSTVSLLGRNFSSQGFWSIANCLDCNAWVDAFPFLVLKSLHPHWYLFHSLDDFHCSTNLVGRT